MSITKLSSREFNQDTSKANRGPVFITDRGRPSHVLLTAEEYQRKVGGPKSSLTCWRCPKLLKLSLSHSD
jgi:hypothetical protein